MNALASACGLAVFALATIAAGSWFVSTKWHAAPDTRKVWEDTTQNVPGQYVEYGEHLNTFDPSPWCGPPSDEALARCRASCGYGEAIPVENWPVKVQNGPER
jgi:hypothetical protein